MSVENPSGPESSDKGVTINNTADGTLWYLDKDQKVVILDDAAEMERERQGREPDSDPAEGYPKFNGRMRSKELPAGTPNNNEVLSDDARAHIQENIRISLQNLDMTDEERAQFEQIIPTINSTAAAQKIAEQIAKIHKVTNGTVNKHEGDPAHLTQEQIAKLQKGAEGLSERGDGGYSQRAASAESAAEMARLKRNQLLKNATGFNIVHHPDNFAGGPNAGQTDYWEHPEMPGEIFTLAEVEAAQAAKKARMEATPGKIARGKKETTPKDPRENGWDTGGPEFRGLEPKLVKELINGPDQLGFSILLESVGNGLEVKRKMQEGIMLSLDEQRMVNFARYEYTRRLKQVEFIQSKLDVADLEVAARNDPDFDALLQFTGKARTLEVFKKQILQMGMMKKETLDTVYNTYANLAHLRDQKTYQKWEKGVQDLCARRGITMKYYDADFRTSDKEQRVETRRTIQEEIRHGWGPFRRAIDHATGSSFRKADRMVRKANKHREAMQANDVVRGVHNEIDSLVNILRFSLVDNHEARLMLQQEAVRNHDLNTSAENGPKTFTEAKTAEAKSSTERKAAFEKAVKDFKTKDGRDWDHATVDERTEGLGSLRNARAREEAQLGQGWFARALLAITRAAFGQQEQDVINKPTLK